jgi:hypothetical protein
MARVLLVVLAIWVGLAVPVAVFVAALGRSALREDQALGHVPIPVESTSHAGPGVEAVRAAPAPGGPEDGGDVPLPTGCPTAPT